MGFDTAYEAISEDTDAGHRWAFGTGFTDPLAGVDTAVPPGVSGATTGEGAHVHHNTSSSDLAPGSMAATAPESNSVVLGGRRGHFMSIVPSMPTGSRTALTLRAGTWRDDAVPRSLGLGRPNCWP